MSAQKMTPILPPGQAEEKPLFVIMTIMAFLAALTLIIVLMGVRQSQSWENDLRSSATLQLVGADAAIKGQNAVDILKQDPAISSAKALSPSENRKLLNPWIGELDLPEDIQIPVLIEINADMDRLDLEALHMKLSEAGITEKIDTHTIWSQNLITTWERLRLALLLLLLLILGATFATASFATQSVIRSRQNIIKVLGQVGATEEFISRLFVKRFMSTGFKASMTGIVTALIFVSVFMLWQNLGTNSDGLKLRVDLIDLAWLIGLAGVLGIISAISAGRAARQSIRKGRIIL